MISTYGASLANKSAPHNDPVWHLGKTDELLNFRQYTIDVLQQAKVYLLDHAAAAYADTLHDTVQDRTENENVAALTFLGEVEPLGKVAWVEFDYRELVAARVRRGSPVIEHHENPSGSGKRGYLIDDRDTDALTVTMFSCDPGGGSSIRFLPCDSSVLK